MHSQLLFCKILLQDQESTENQDVASTITKFTWCGICFQKVPYDLRVIRNHKCMQEICIPPHFLRIEKLDSNKNLHFYPIRHLKFVQTEIDSNGNCKHAYVDLPVQMKSKILEIYQKHKKNNSSTTISSQHSTNETSNIVPMNRQLIALKNKENLIVNTPQRNQLKNPQQKFLTIEQLKARKLIPAATRSSSPLKEQQIAVDVHHDIREISDAEDEEEDSEDIPKLDEADNIIEFLITEVHNRRAIWDAAIPHVQRTEQQSIDWAEILENLLGNVNIFK